MASFSCKCGLVHVQFAVNQAKTRINCCCCDCYQKLEWAQSQGGPSLLEAHVNMDHPLWVEHWNARMTVTGKEHLTFNKLHENAPSVNCVAKCCSTILFVDHPGYQGNVVLLYPEMINLVDSVHLDSLDFISFTKDWPDEHVHKIDDSIPQFYVDENGEFTGVGDWVPVVQRVMGSFGVPAEGEGQLFSDLLMESGGEVTSLNFEPRKCH